MVTNGIERAELIAAVAQAADGIVITDTGGKIRYVNPAFTAMTGYSSEEVIGRTTSMLKSGRQPAAFYEQLWNTIRSGRVWHDQVINRRKDGTFYCEDMRISPVRDDQGKTVSYIAIKHDVTQQRANEEAQQFLAAIVESSRDAIITFTPAGILLTWNRGAELVFGHTPAEAIGKHVSMLVVPEELYKLANFAEEIVRGRVAPQYEGLGLRKDGRRFHIAVTGCLILNSAGGLVAVSAILRDVSRRKAAQEALQESEERFRIMADSCPSPMWVTGEAGRIQFINRAYREYFGVSPERLEEFAWELLVHPDEATLYLGVFLQSVAERSAFRMECRVRRADGAWRWVLSYAEPRLSAQGEFLGHGGMSVDITDRKLAEQANRDSQAFAQATIDALSSHVCVLDETGTIIAVNHAWRAFAAANGNFAGDPSRCGEGMNYLAVCAQASGPEPAAGLEFALGIQSVLNNERQQFTQEYTCHSPEEQRWFVGKVTRFQSSRLPRILIEHINITELKRAEQVALKAQQSAEDANQAKSRFLAAMSHEIRTPMNAILGMADVLWESDLASEQRQFVEVFRRAGSNLLVLINDILDLSKIEAGQIELEKVDFDLEEVVDQVIELIGVKTRAKGVALLCHMAPEVPVSLAGDPVRLRQVLTNLLGNASKFTDSGEVLLRVQNNPAKAGEVEFLVSDTGIGIPAEKLEVIFDAFTQADASTTGKYGGTGLGLGISRRLVDQMGGQLTVTSSIGIGSTFRFSVPFELARKSVKANAEQEDFHGRRVLVIGDNATNRVILQETLNGWGFEIDVFASPHDALMDLAGRMAGRQPYALVVLDRQIDGFEVVAKIRKVAVGLPVVMLTSDASPGDVRLRKEAGLSGYAVHPVKRTDLLRLVCEAMKPREDLKPKAPGNPKHPKTSAVKSLHILLAEDSPDNRMLIQVYLKSGPHRLTFAEDGQAAVDCAAKGHFDLILMDIRMPVMDGLSATRAIRAREALGGLSPIPILALSANASPEDVDMSRAAGCDEHLSKPISKVKLLKAIEAHGARAERVGPPIAVEMPPDLEEFVPSYVAARRKEVPEMMRLLAASDFERITVLSHDLKGTGGGYGLPELTRIGAALHDAAKKTDSDAVGRRLAELSDYLARVQLIASRP